MEEELSLDNIVDVDNLFTDADPPEEETQEPEKSEEQTENNEETTEVNVDTLFDDSSESVGSNSEEIDSNLEDSSDTEDSSQNSLFSSITQALVDEGVFPDLDNEVINNTNNALAFKQLIEDRIQEGIDLTYKRINEALGVGVEPEAIVQYENTLQLLHSITEENLTAEDENGENLRKQLIYQDFINRGYSKERAVKEVNKSLNSGSDIDDAREALQGNKDFYGNYYKKLVEEKKLQQQKEKEEVDAGLQSMQSDILEDVNLFGGMEIDKKTRQRIADNLIKPVYKDSKTGEQYSAIQYYQKTNPKEFIKNLSTVFTLTDGFKNINNLVKGKVNKEVKKGLADLERTINGSSRGSNGMLKFASNDSESFIGKGWKLDI